MTPVVGSSPGLTDAQRDALVEQEKQQTAFIRESFGRVPITVFGLLQEVNNAGWPTDVWVHPVDFFFLITQGISVHKDATGPYFYLSASRIRPRQGQEGVLDLSEWEPSKIKLATFLGE